MIVLDSESSDDTANIARRLNAKVTKTADWPGYGPQKNRAIELASGDWVLSLDADEWVTPQLRAELEHAMENAPGNQTAFKVPRLSSYCGRFMRHSGWWPDYVSWLAERCGEEKAAPAELGGGGLVPVSEAPGTYVYDH